MNERMVMGGVAIGGVILAAGLLVLLMPGEPGPDPEPDRREVRDGPSEPRLSTRVVTPEPLRPEVDGTPVGADLLEVTDPVEPDDVPEVRTDGPVPATYQGLRELFGQNGGVVQHCLQGVEHPPPGETPLPSRVTVQVTVQPDERLPTGAMTGLEVMGDYDRAFSGFSRCMAERFGAVTFKAPLAGTVTTLTWQQTVPRQR